MSGCNCKTEDSVYNGENLSLGKNILKYTFKVSVFSLSLLTLPIIVIASIWILFRTLVLNKDVNITGMLKFMVKAFKNANNSNDDDDDDDYYDDEDEYELMDVENITYQKTDSK